MRPESARRCHSPGVVIIIMMIIIVIVIIMIVAAAAAAAAAAAITPTIATRMSYGVIVEPIEMAEIRLGDRRMCRAGCEEKQPPVGTACAPVRMTFVGTPHAALPRLEVPSHDLQSFMFCWPTHRSWALFANISVNVTNYFCRVFRMAGASGRVHNFASKLSFDRKHSRIPVVNARSRTVSASARSRGRATGHVRRFLN